VKEFAELVQGDLEQADQDLTTLEADLSEEKRKSVSSEKNRKGGATKGRDEDALDRKNAKHELAAAQRETDSVQRNMRLQEDIYGRQRSVYEAGLRET